MVSYSGAIQQSIETVEYTSAETCWAKAHKRLEKHNFHAQQEFETVDRKAAVRPKIKITKFEIKILALKVPST